MKARGNFRHKYAGKFQIDFVHSSGLISALCYTAKVPAHLFLPHCRTLIEDRECIEGIWLSLLISLLSAAFAPAMVTCFSLGIWMFRPSFDPAQYQVRRALGLPTDLRAVMGGDRRNDLHHLCRCRYPAAADVQGRHCQLVVA